MPELLGPQGGVCRKYRGLRGGYAGTFVGSKGGMPELLWARGGEYAGTIRGFGGGYAGTFVGLGGGMPELLRA